MKNIIYATLIGISQLLGINTIIAQNNIPISNITEIEVSGIIPVVLVQDENEFMDLSKINNEWREVLKYSIKGNTLKIKTSKSETTVQKDKPLTIHLKDLSKIKLEGITNIKTSGIFKLNTLSIEMSGISSANLELDVKELYLSNEGAAKIKLTGKAEQAKFDLKGVSHTNGEKFQIGDLHIDAEGASNGKTQVLKEVSGEISGVSKFEILGTPENSIEYSGIYSKRSNEDYIALISIGDTNFLHVDTTTFRWGDKTIIIFSDSTSSTNRVKDTIPHPRLKWSGIDIGLNGLMNNSNSTDLSNPAGTAPEDRTDFMEIDLRHSWMFRLNFLELDFKTKNERFGILTGLGFEWNSYELKNNVRLTAKGRSIIDPNTNPTNQNYTYGIYDSTTNFSKNRLKTFKLNVPVLLEANFGKEKDFYIVGGAIFGFNLKSKMKYKSSNGKEKLKEDFNINPLSASLHAKIGYKGTALFATYGMSTLFEKNDGPEVHPFSLGLSFNL